MAAALTRSRLALVCSALLTLGGCVNDEPSNALSLSASGDSVAANRIRHIIDPWPKGSFSQAQPTDGARIGASMERYRSGLPVAVPAGSASSASRTTN